MRSSPIGICPVCSISSRICARMVMSPGVRPYSNTGNPSGPGALPRDRLCAASSTSFLRTRGGDGPSMNSLKIDRCHKSLHNLPPPVSSPPVASALNFFAKYLPKASHFICPPATYERGPVCRRVSPLVSLLLSRQVAKHGPGIITPCGCQKSPQAICADDRD